MKYYNYVFLDPRKPGKFHYGTHSFEFEPFYVGKGKGSRFKRHLNKSQLADNSNSIKNGKLHHIIEAGFNPLDYVIIIHNELDKCDANDNEIQLIKTIGRIDLKTGPLANLTSGGEGMLEHSSSLKGRSYEEIHGVELANKLKNEKSNRFKGANNPRFGKPGTWLGKHLTEQQKETLRRKQSVPIVQLTKDGEIIQEWPSILVAATKLNISPTAIGNCLKGRAKTSKGFKWKYVEATYTCIK